METQKALFMGRITAGVTHEIKNVLAIIKESAGLIEDLTALWKKDPPPKTDKIIKTLTKITDQVNRGVELSTGLNEFAHTPDQSVAVIALNTAVERVVSLSQRFARLNRVQLEALRRDGERTISTDPLSFLMLMFKAIELLMNVVGENGLISVEPSLAERDLVMISAHPPEMVTTTPDVGFVMHSKDFQQMQDLSARLNMTVTLESCPLRITIGKRIG